jgi:internalin A
MAKNTANSEAAKRIAEITRTGARELSLGGLGLQELPDALWDLERLQQLNVAYNELTTLPAELGRLTQLQRLSVMHNRLTALPAALWELIQLRDLNVSHNRLTSMPEMLSRLARLQKLSVAHNELVLLPGALGQLTELQTLDVSHNPLYALPEVLGQLTEITALDVSNTNLRILPEVLGSLKQLQRLSAWGNQLSTLPETLSQLTQLRRLDLRSNDLESLPYLLRQLADLEQLYLHGNHNLGLPDEVLGPVLDDPNRSHGVLKPPAEILDYYFRVRPPPEEKESVGGKPLLEARIIVIGDGGAGKTSLLRQLVQGLSAQKDEASTRDVTVARWQVQLKGTSVNVNLWDFGGQRQMHAAHPYFFTTRTLYLVVAEARKDQQDRVDYWLKMVAKYGDMARALVVVNKADGHAKKGSNYSLDILWALR